MGCLELRLSKTICSQHNKLVKIGLLGKARVDAAVFEDPDGSPITINSNYFAKKRNIRNPMSGPFGTLEQVCS